MNGTLVGEKAIDALQTAGATSVAVLVVQPDQQRHDISWHGLVELLTVSFSAVRLEVVAVADPTALHREARIAPHDAPGTPWQAEHFGLVVVVISRIEDLWLLSGCPDWRSMAGRFVLVHAERPGAVATDVDIWGLTPLLEAFDLVATTDASLFTMADVHVIEMGSAIDGSALMLPIGGVRPIDLLVLGRVTPARRRLLTEWADRTGRTCEILDDGMGGDRRSPAELHDHMTTAKFVLLDEPIGHDLDDLRSVPLRRQESGAPGVAVVDALAAGCGIVGRLPVGGATRRMFGELPGLFDLGPAPRDLPAEVDDLIDDPIALGLVAAAHRAEALRRHDVAHRVLSLFLSLDAPVPDQLLRRVRALEALATATLDRAARVHAAGPGGQPSATANAPAPAPEPVAAPRAPRLPFAMWPWRTIARRAAHAGRY
ncbi:MAG: hypothetical protein AB7Q42_20340 [Acidimicrobiia bacterium]